MRSWRVVVSAVGAVALAIALGATAVAGTELEPYVAHEVLALPYGEEEELPGRVAGDGEAVAPTSIALDTVGRLLVSDPAKSRVVAYDSEGRHLESIPVEGVPIDMVDTKSRLAVLDGAGGEIVMVGRSGGEQGRSPVPRGLLEAGVRRLALQGPVVSVLSGDGETHPVADVRTRRDVSMQRQNEGTRGRIAGGSVYEPLYADGGRIIRYKPDGTIDLEVRLRQRNLLTVDVAGEDASGAFYVIAEIGLEDGYRTECLKYSRAGSLLSRFDVASDQGWTVRPTVVGADGTVYRLVAGEHVTTVTAYSPHGGEKR